MGSADTFELKNLRGAAQLLGESVPRLSTRASFAHMPQGPRATTPGCQAKVDEQNDGAADRRSIGVVMGSGFIEGKPLANLPTQKFALPSGCLALELVKPLFHLLKSKVCASGIVLEKSITSQS